MTIASLHVDTSMTGTGSSTLSSSIPVTSPAFETTLVSYANKILKVQSPATAVIDPSVAPYVTSILRSSLSNLSDTESSNSDKNDKALDIRTLVEYDALMELLMEQCDMESDKAHLALKSIAHAIQTGEFQDFGGRSRSASVGLGFHRHRQSSFSSSLIGNGTISYLGIGNGNLSSMGGKFRSKSMGAEHDYYGEDDAIRFLGNMLKESTSSDLKATDIATATDHDDDGFGSLLHVHATSARRRSMDSSIRTGTLSDWRVSKRQDSPEMAEGVVSVIEEEPSYYFEDEEVNIEETPVKYGSGKANIHIMSSSTPGSGTTMQNPSGDLLTGGLSPFLTEEERKVAEGLKNLPTPMFSFTPLKQDQLIPLDLLGVIDDPSTPASADLGRRQGSPDNLDSAGHTNHILDSANDKIAENGNEPERGSDGDALKEVVALDKSSQEPTVLPVKPQMGGGKGKKKVKKKDTELAAALFAKPRSRSISYDEKSPKLKPLAPPPASKIGLSGLKNCSADALMSNSIPALFKKQLDSAVEILMAMNFDICQDAAHEAALVSNADVNIAQHVIDGALSAPPVCRHLLKDGCYRSDCQFSHDVDGHTCLFWLRGRCGKGDACRFMHGFSEKLLDGIKVDFLNPSDSQDKAESTFALPPAQSSTMKPPVVKTGNLVQYNVKNSFSLSKMAFGGSTSNVTSFNIPAENTAIESFEEGSNSLFPAVARKESSNLETVEVTASTSTPNQASNVPSFSFASIASKGYNKMSSFNEGKTNEEQNDSINKDSCENKTVRIPQNLWTAAQNRVSGAFHILDPIARFKEVSNSVQREDVIDLHFQSVKTFPTVLSSFLPAKLKDHGEVWVVTGSGHHVSRNSHQKGGGVLENAVISWLSSNEYKFSRGKDKNGFGGALLVYSR